jgi:putative methyltransferase (TIGR04325 family)
MSSMSPQINQILKDWLPPKVSRILKGIFRQGVTWKGNYHSWDVAKKNSKGYDDTAILEKVKSALLKIKSGDAVYERDSVLFDKIEYSWPLLASLMWVAASSEGRLNVLDFGGSLGSSYFQNRILLSTLKHVQWNIVEQKHFVEAGKKYFEDENLKFYYDIESCINEKSPNSILFSSVIQYIEKPLELLKKIKSIGFEYIVFDRTGFVNSGKDRLTVQIVPSAIYPCSYPCWFFDRKKFYSFFEDKYEVIASFEASDKTNLPATFEGSILRMKNV